MISIEESVPKKSSNYLLGQDVIWNQFNDVNFYVEDEDQENFYFQVFKKIFPDIKFEKIFPLRGKDSVISEAKNAIGDKRKVFILDQDFDELLNRKTILNNIFYLNRYSIENYLIEEDAIFEFLAEENPKIKRKDFRLKFNVGDYLKECAQMFTELTCNFILIQKYNLEIEYLRINVIRDCDFMPGRVCLKPTLALNYYAQIRTSLGQRHGRVKYEVQIRKLKKYFRNIIACLTNIPGKYLLNNLKVKLQKIFSISQINKDSFVYRLGKNCKLSDLNYLKEGILNYMS